jgi:hypothetical protein
MGGGIAVTVTIEKQELLDRYTDISAAIFEFDENQQTRFFRVLQIQVQSFTNSAIFKSLGLFSQGKKF